MGKSEGKERGGGSGGGSGGTNYTHYAVAKGRETGIFRSYLGVDGVGGAEASVTTFPGNENKGFNGFEEAALYMEERGLTRCDEEEEYGRWAPVEGSGAKDGGRDTRGSQIEMDERGEDGNSLEDLEGYLDGSMEHSDGEKGEDGARIGQGKAADVGLHEEDEVNISKPAKRRRDDGLVWAGCDTSGCGVWETAGGGTAAERKKARDFLDGRPWTCGTCSSIQLSAQRQEVRELRCEMGRMEKRQIQMEREAGTLRSEHERMRKGALEAGGVIERMGKEIEALKVVVRREVHEMRKVLEAEMESRMLYMEGRLRREQGQVDRSAGLKGSKGAEASHEEDHEVEGREVSWTDKGQKVGEHTRKEVQRGNVDVREMNRPLDKDGSREGYEPLQSAVVEVGLQASMVQTGHVARAIPIVNSQREKGKEKVGASSSRTANLMEGGRETHILVRGAKGEMKTEEVEEILGEVVGKEVKVENMWWVGGQTALVVVVKNRELRDTVLRGKAVLRQSKWSNVFLGRDLPFEERQLERARLQEGLRRAWRGVKPGEVARIRGRKVVVGVRRRVPTAILQQGMIVEGAKKGETRVALG